MMKLNVFLLLVVLIQGVAANNGANLYASTQRVVETAAPAPTEECPTPAAPAPAPVVEEYDDCEPVGYEEEVVQSGNDYTAGVDYNEENDNADGYDGGDADNNVDEEAVYDGADEMSNNDNGDDALYNSSASSDSSDDESSAADIRAFASLLFSVSAIVAVLPAFF